MEILQPRNMIINGNSTEHLSIDDPRRINIKKPGWWTSHLDLISKDFSTVSKYIRVIGIYVNDVEVPTIDIETESVSLMMLKTDEIGRRLGDYNLNAVNEKVKDNIKIIDLVGVSTIIYFQLENDENIYVSVGYNIKFTDDDRYTFRLHYDKKLEREKIKNVERVVILPEFDNKNRKRYYGKRIGDVVKFEAPVNRQTYYGVVSNYSPSDNNRLEVTLPDGKIQKLTAEICDVVFPVEMLGKHNQLLSEAKTRINVLHQIVTNKEDVGEWEPKN